MSNFAIKGTQSVARLGAAWRASASRNPLRGASRAATLTPMSRLVIRCDRRGAPSDELEQWLEQQVGRLVRHEDEHARVSRVTRQSAGEEQEVGWLVEIERDGPATPAIDRETLADLLRDMRLVGLEPSVLVPGDQVPATD